MSQTLLPYTPDALKAALTATLLGRRIEVHPQVSSTNDLVREAARRGEPEGLVIVAEEQVAGRGRLGRVWSAPPGCCILCSVLLRPRFSPQYAFYLTIATSLAIYRAITRLGQRIEGTSDRPKPQVSIKWPNDVLVGGRKVAGVLCESEFSGHAWAFTVVGFGINVNLEDDRLGELKETATSLSTECGREIDRSLLLADVLAELESIYFLLQRGQPGTVYSEWIPTLETIGKRVIVAEAGGSIEGTVLRVERDGALVLRLDSGAERKLLVGDVTHMKRVEAR